MKTQAGAVGIGGIFFKAKDQEALKQWYIDALGLPHENGEVFFNSADETPGARTVFAIFEEHSDYFGDDGQNFMINFRVGDLNALLDRLKVKNVEILKHEDHPYGQFAWIVDPQGNRIELWEPREQE